MDYSSGNIAGPAGKDCTLTGTTITSSRSARASIFPNARNIVLNGCIFVAAPGGTVNMSRHLDNTDKQSEGFGDSSRQPCSHAAKYESGLSHSFVDQDRTFSFGLTDDQDLILSDLNLIQELIECQIKRKSRALEDRRRAKDDMTRADCDIGEADAHLARYRKLEADLRRGE